MALLSVLSIEVFLHLPEDLPFVECAAYKSVNPIELLWWKLGQRNARVIGYRTLGFQMTSTSPARRW
jgi:hypothetical protein